MLSGAVACFDSEGNLTDEETRSRLKRLIEALARFAQELKERPT